MMALIYGTNSKAGCYTGFTQIRAPDRKSNYLDFLAAQALSGPDSIITCILQPHGPVGATKYIVLEKKTALSQIPGLHYGI